MSSDTNDVEHAAKLALSISTANYVALNVFMRVLGETDPPKAKLIASILRGLADLEEYDDLIAKQLRDLAEAYKSNPGARYAHLRLVSDVSDPSVRGSESIRSETE